MQPWRKHYNEKLQDHRWISFRSKVLSIKGAACEECFSPHNLQIHHPFYKRGCEPWQYDVHEVRVLCDKHHKEAHELENSAMLAFWIAYCRGGFSFLKASIVENTKKQRHGC
jgi:hypothetical protein